MDCKYELKEVDKGYALFGKTGNQLISFLIEEPDYFHVSYNNVNIKEDHMIGAEAECGAIYDWYVKCDSENDCLRCCSRFIELATNGFTSALRELIAMDWGDLEIAGKGGNLWHYYYAEGDLKNINNFAKRLSEKIQTNYCESAQYIVCVDGNLSLDEAYDITDQICDCRGNIIQLLYENTEKIQLDIWVSLKGDKNINLSDIHKTI